MINGYQNLHSHTPYCDGNDSAEDMIIAAIQKGGGSIGFSEHSLVPFDDEYSMSLKDTPIYIAEINRLKEKYKSEIEVFLGIEVDYYTEKVPDGIEFIIGTAHHIKKDGAPITVDGSKEHIKHMCELHFNGDFYAMAEMFFETVADLVPKTGADIVGHFDMLAKHNIDNCLFDERHPRYAKAALKAMEQMLESCKLFEVNTGAMYRVGKIEPYPSEFLLRELQKRGGEVILSSDSHDTDSIYYKFDEMCELLKSCGFKYIKRLTKDGFINEKLR